MEEVEEAEWDASTLKIEVPLQAIAVPEVAPVGDDDEIL